MDEWESAYAQWRSMCGIMQRQNAVLNERVSDLSTQVLSLSADSYKHLRAHETRFLMSFLVFFF
ncbi:MbeD/MobD family mobilization/exclusion protein [Enterobacter intestinihominis]